MNNYKSYAKLNLFLHNVGVRDDGYHELETIFVLIDLYDEISIEKTTDGIIKRISGNESIDECSDLLIKAAKLLQQKTNSKFGANISIKKRIPTGGGLGGGSSNAATVLTALNTLWNTKLSNQKLQTIGVKLGADVPIFIFGKHAFANGIGEKLTPVEIPQKYYLVLCPNCHTSTAKVFSHFALTKSVKQGKIPTFLQAISLDSSLDNGLNGFSNDCLNPAIALSPKIKKTLDYLNSTDNRLSVAKLSGTGSCVFAVFKDKKSCEIALQNLSCKKTNAFIVKSLKV